MLREKILKLMEANWQAEHQTSALPMPALSREMESLLRKVDKGIDTPDAIGRTPLFNAIFIDGDIAELLLEEGANPNIADDRRLTPAYAAITTGNLKMLKLLLDKGATRESILYMASHKAEIKDPKHYKVAVFMFANELLPEPNFERLGALVRDITRSLNKASDIKEKLQLVHLLEEMRTGLEKYETKPISYRETYTAGTKLYEQGIQNPTPQQIEEAALAVRKAMAEGMEAQLAHARPMCEVIKNEAMNSILGTGELKFKASASPAEKVLTTAELMNLIVGFLPAEWLEESLTIPQELPLTGEDQEPEQGGAAEPHNP